MNKELQYVFDVDVLSCKDDGSWVSRNRHVSPNNGNVYAIAGAIAASELKPVERGVRVTFRGLRKVGESEITPMGPFVLTLVKEVQS